MASGTLEGNVPKRKVSIFFYSQFFDIKNVEFFKMFIRNC